MTDAYLTTMVRISCDLSGAQGASLFLVDGSILRPYIIYNLPQAYIAGIGMVRIGSQCCGRAVEHKKPWIVTDMTDPLFAEGRKGALETPIRAAFSVPVVDKGHAVASLACHYVAPFTPSELDIERNEVFAKLIAMSLKDRGPVSLVEPIFAFAHDGMAPPLNVPAASTVQAGTSLVLPVI